MMFDAFLAGLLLVFQWPTFGYLLAGVVSGILIGVIPGLGGGIGIVLLLPFTFGFDSVSAFALLLGMYGVTMTGDTVTSVMLTGYLSSNKSVFIILPASLQNSLILMHSLFLAVNGFQILNLVLMEIWLLSDHMTIKYIFMI